MQSLNISKNIGTNIGKNISKNISPKISVIIIYALLILYTFINYNDLLLDYSEVIPILSLILILVPKHIKVSIL